MVVLEGMQGCNHINKELFENTEKDMMLLRWSYFQLQMAEQFMQEPGSAWMCQDEPRHPVGRNQSQTYKHLPRVSSRRVELSFSEENPKVYCVGSSFALEFVPVYETSGQTSPCLLNPIFIV